jgi:outer membrane cobalamin receptor
MPGFSYLYRNPELKKSTGITMFGNPDLNAQKTVMYELGLQQQLSSTTAFDLTVYYRDIINWLSSEYNFIDNTFRYTKYITQDYGNIRGVAVSFTQRSRQGLALNLDYTFQIAEGNASAPDAAYYEFK